MERLYISVCQIEETTDYTRDLFIEFDENMQENEITIQDKIEHVMECLNKLSVELNKFSTLTNPGHVFELYDKQIKKLATMLLEFKNCISMSRAALQTSKKPPSSEINFTIDPV
jgi:hypothetical protein